MSLSIDDLNILGSIINTTYGRDSASKKASTYNTSAYLSGNTMVIKCITVVNLIDANNMMNEKRKCEKELDQVINHFVGKIKKDFKAEAGRSLKMKKNKDSEDTSVELAGYYSPFSPKRTAYVKRNITFEIT
jgi:hypothetical protein